MLRAFAPKGARIFYPENAKTGLGLAMIAIPKPVYSGFTVFWAVSAPKARKLPDLSGRQIRQLICQKAKKDDAERIQRHLKQFSVVYFVALMLTTAL